MELSVNPPCYISSQQQLLLSYHLCTVTCSVQVLPAVYFNPQNYNFAQLATTHNLSVPPCLQKTEQEEHLFLLFSLLRVFSPLRVEIEGKCQLPGAERNEFLVTSVVKIISLTVVSASSRARSHTRRADMCLC